MLTLHFPTPQLVYIFSLPVDGRYTYIRHPPLYSAHFLDLMDTKHGRNRLYVLSFHFIA